MQKFTQKVILFLEWIVILIGQLLQRDLPYCCNVDLIIYEGLSLNIYQKPRFVKVLELARKKSLVYIHPNKKIISKVRLDVINEHNMKRSLTNIQKKYGIFGLLFLGGGTTITRTTLLSILASGKIYLLVF